MITSGKSSTPSFCCFAFPLLTRQVFSFWLYCLLLSGRMLALETANFLRNFRGSTLVQTSCWLTVFTSTEEKTFLFLIFKRIKYYKDRSAFWRTTGMGKRRGGYTTKLYLSSKEWSQCFWNTVCIFIFIF